MRRCRPHWAIPHGEVELFPDAWSVFKQMAPIYMHGMIFGAMTESYCAEQSARMTAMDSATKSATDMIHALQLEYNRTRQCNHPGDHRDHRRCFCCANQRLLNFLHCIPIGIQCSNIYLLLKFKEEAIV